MGTEEEGQRVGPSEEQLKALDSAILAARQLSWEQVRAHIPNRVAMSKEFIDALEKTRTFRDIRNAEKHKKFQPLRGKYVLRHKGKPRRQHWLG